MHWSLFQWMNRRNSNLSVILAVQRAHLMEAIFQICINDLDKWHIVCVWTGCVYVRLAFIEIHILLIWFYLGHNSSLKFQLNMLLNFFLFIWIKFWSFSVCCFPPSQSNELIEICIWRWLCDAWNYQGIYEHKHKQPGRDFNSIHKLNNSFTAQTYRMD